MSAQAPTTRYRVPRAEDLPSDGDPTLFKAAPQYLLVMNMMGKSETYRELENSLANAQTDAERAQINAAMKSPGVTGAFFVRQDDIMRALDEKDESWVPVGWSRFIRKMGEERVKGFVTDNLSVAVAAQRRVRRLNKEEETKPGFSRAALPKMLFWYQSMTDVQHGKYKPTVQMIGLVKGLEALGAVCVTMKSVTARKLLGEPSKNENGILNLCDRNTGGNTAFYRSVIAPASKQVGATVPQSIFWLTLGHAVDEQGFPVWSKIAYGDAGKFVEVCNLVWRDEARLKADPTLWKELAVPKEGGLRDQIEEIRKGSYDWAHAWDREALKNLNRELAQSGDDDYEDEASDEEERSSSEPITPSPARPRSWDDMVDSNLGF